MAGALALLGSPSPAHATEPSATGWWWVGQTGPVALAPAPAVPEGGLYVAGGLGRPGGVSALRFELEEGEDAEALTLAVADAIGTPAIVACSTLHPWEPAEGGAWSDRPAADCDRGTATAELSDDGRHLRFDLSAVPQDGTIDITLLPSPEEGSSPFSVSLEPPGADALELGPAPVADPLPEPAPDLAERVELLPVAPRSPSFAPRRPAVGGAAPAAQEAPSTVVVAAPAATTTPAAVGSIAEGFAYPIIFVLPLLLLVGGSTLAWTLTRPIVVEQQGLGAAVER